MSNKKLASIIIICSVVVCGLLIVLIFSNRYQYVNGKVFDKITGTITNPTEQTTTEKESVEFIKRAEQYQKDMDDGKIENFSKYDIERIKSGLQPEGIYKNKEDEPDWYSSNKSWTPENFK